MIILHIIIILQSYIRLQSEAVKKILQAILRYNSFSKNNINKIYILFLKQTLQTSNFNKSLLAKYLFTLRGKL